MNRTLPLLFVLAACAESPVSSPGFDSAAVAEPLDLDAALDIAEALGVNPDALIYADQLPMVVSDQEAVMTWGFIELTDEGSLVTQLDMVTGEPQTLREEPAPNIRDFIDQTGLELTALTWGAAQNSYDSFPWSWRLPFESTSNAWLTSGYGHGSSYGETYATDWDPGNAGHLLESPASCWVMYTSYNSSWGYQVVAQCGSAGGGRNYYYRTAHMRSVALVTPGWWMAKDTNIGYMGSTGNSTGAHVHFTVYRASSTSGGSFTNWDTVPINRWPSSSDSICNGALARYNFSNSMQNLGAMGSNGCP